MWTVFKLANFLWLMTTTYMWLTTYLPFNLVGFLINVVMMVCLGFLPIKLEFGKSIAKIMLAMSAFLIWIVCCSDIGVGIFNFVCLLPVVWLVLLPKNYQKDLLAFVTKWYAIMLAIGLVEYFLVLAGAISPFGSFKYGDYSGFDNYGFYIRNTFDFKILLDRFNAFFLEPGHQALTSTFLLIANSFRFKKNPYLIILLLGVIFSFSLAGYLLAAVAAVLFFVKNLKGVLIGVAVVASFTIISLTYNNGENALNELIVSRLEYDKQKGVEGNNRFTSSTDYVYDRACKKGLSWVGVQSRYNMDMVAGAGFKIYVIHYGWIGVILAALFYLALIPKNANKKYTATFLIVLTLCFIQRSYPTWYSWLLPYILGIYINADSDNTRENDMEESEDDPDLDKNLIAE